MPLCRLVAWSCVGCRGPLAECIVVKTSSLPHLDSRSIHCFHCIRGETHQHFTLKALNTSSIGEYEKTRPPVHGKGTSAGAKPSPWVSYFTC